MFFFSFILWFKSKRNYELLLLLSKDKLIQKKSIEKDQNRITCVFNIPFLFLLYRSFSCKLMLYILIIFNICSYFMQDNRWLEIFRTKCSKLKHIYHRYERNPFYSDYIACHALYLSY